MSAAAEPILAPIALGVGLRPGLQRCGTDLSHNDCVGKISDIENNKRPLTANRELSIIEVETKLRECLRAKYSDIVQSFQNYDDSRSLSVSTGQFRRVLEVHCMPLTSGQFDAILNKVNATSDGTVRYCDFLDKFCGTNSRATSADRWKCATIRCGSAALTAASKPDIIEKMLQDKIQTRLPDILEALRLYDFNRDGTVQSHSLHRVLDRLCFETSDTQFDRIYQKFNLRRNGTVNYREFFSRLGVRFEKSNSNKNGTVVVGSQPSTVKGTPASGQAVNKIPVSDADLFDIEDDFRKKMRDNFANVKRMFMAFDRHLDGFISLVDLKSVLDNFTIPMSDEVFSELMSRFGIKATGKVSWEHFLNKFQNPLADRNGQTIPIKPAHKFFPIRGADENMQFSDVVKLLVRHVKNSHSSLKNAFLEMDKNRDGRISRRELREMLDKTFAFRLSSENFNELMSLLDPQKTNAISYKDFLDLFEQRESLGGHKWLNTCHRTKPHRCALVAWSTVEGNIRDKVEQLRTQVVEDLERRDVNHRGWVTLKVLRKVIEKFVLPVTDEHFCDMINRLAVIDEESGLVNYSDFFLALGVTLKPDDSVGVSTQIIDGSQQTADDHHAAQKDRLQEIEERACDRTCSMDPDEILTRLRDKMSQKSSNLRLAFHYYSNKHRGRITRKDLRKILESFGFQLPDDQFADLCKHLSFTNGYMNYTDFVRGFESRRPWTPTAIDRTPRPPNHRVNEIRGDELGMSADELLSKLKQKFDENFENLHDVFHKFDTNRDGVLTKNNFRNMLNSFMMITTDDEFDKLCDKLGVGRESRITYDEFLRVFQLLETKDGHKWLKSTHRYNQPKQAKNLDAAETRDVLIRKMHESWNDLAKAFRSLAARRNGTVTRSDLRKLLGKYSLQLDSGPFGQLWNDIDTEGKGHITYDEFLRYFMADEFAPSDNDGISRRIFVENRDTLKELREDQERRQNENQLIEANHVCELTTDEIVVKLRNRFQDQFVDLQAAFKHFDTNNKGYLTSRDFQHLLGRLDILIDDDQLFDLFQRLHLSTGKAKLSYEEFVRVFEEGRTETFKLGDVEDVECPSMSSSRLSNSKLEERLQRKIEEQQDILLSACRSFDQKESGLVRTIDLRRILDMFCLRLTDDQFRHVMKVFSCTKLPYDAAFIDYRRFIDRLKNLDSKEPQKMLESLQQQVAANGCQSPEELQSLVRQKVADNALAVERAFADVDYAELGVVTRRDFRDVLGMHVMSLSEDQFNKLWPVLPVNEFDNLDYRAFLSQCASSAAAAEASQSPANEHRAASASARERPRPSTTGSLPSRVGSAMSQRTATAGRPFTPLVNAEPSETKVREKVRGHWKSFQRDCRQQDADNTGLVTQRDFREFARKYDFGLTEDETFKLLVKYDLKNNGTFSYVDFLRRFVLSSTAPDGGTGRTSQMLLRRSSSGPNVLRISSPDEKRAPVAALDKIRNCIVNNWKDMRRELRAADPSGLASSELFRQALRNVQADLDEEDFFDITVHFEDRSTRKIRYDDFFRHFLQSS